MNPELLDAGVEIIGAVAWPAAICWAVWMLKDYVATLLPRITEIGPTGVKLSTTTTIQVPSAPSATVAANIALMKGFISPEVLDPLVEEGRRELSKLAPTPSEQIDFLIHVTASMNVQLAYERTYSVIFASQVRALRALQATYIREDGLRPLYAEAAAAFPAMYEKLNFDQWLQFLTSSKLISKRIEGDVYELTPTGRGFLKYMVDRRLPEIVAY